MDEFTSKVAHAEKYARDFGPRRTAAAAIGEGCYAMSAIEAPANAKASGKKAGSDHLLSASISGVRSP